MIARVTRFGSHALEISLAINTIDSIDQARVARRLVAHLNAKRIDFVSEWVASYAHIVVHLREGYDSRKAARWLTEYLAEHSAEALDTPLPEGTLHLMHTRYDGPDLGDVADRLKMSRTAVIEAHAAVDYEVEMLGFLPGFAYLGVLTETLALPRKTTPRTRVPAQSVAIADQRTAIYPVASPGGWHLIGTVVSPLVFDRSASQSILFSPGDRVRFVPIDAQEHA